MLPKPTSSTTSPDSSAGLRLIRKLVILTLLIACAACTWTSHERLQLGRKATLIIKRSYRPGFVDPSIRWEFQLKWRSGLFGLFGASEKLPPGVPWAMAQDPAIEVRTDAVWIFCGLGFAMRNGDAEATGNPWTVWQAVPASDALFDYMDHVASKNRNDGISTRRSYTIPKRLGRNTVSNTEHETLPILVYTSAPADGPPYFTAPTNHMGHWLPHQLQRIDFDARAIYCTSPKEIPGMPRHLVFSPDTDSPGQWRFNRKMTEAENGD